LRAVAQADWDRAAGMGEAALLPLGAALADSDAHVREAAAAALGRSGVAAAVGLLIGALADKDARVGRAAATGLGRLGTDAQAAIGPLTALRDAADEKLAKAAAEALEKIRRAGATA
jgi:HEAT repeat protein